MRKMMEESLVHTKISYTRHDQIESLVVDFGQIEISAKEEILMNSMV
jgi:hypothetical protein